MGDLGDKRRVTITPDNLHEFVGQPVFLSDRCVCIHVYVYAYVYVYVYVYVNVYVYVLYVYVNVHSVYAMYM